MRDQPFRIITQSAAFFQAVIHTVRLDIRLIVNIQSVFVAEFIEFTVLRIVA